MTGPELVREGLRSIEPVMQEIIIHAQSEIQLVAYVFTPQAEQILDLIRQAAERGVSVTIVVNNFRSQNEKIRSEIISLQQKYSRTKIVDFRDKSGRQLHAKVLVVDRKSAVIGSANFSWGGMVTNFEIGVLLIGENAWKVGQIVDTLVSHAQSI